MLKSKLGKKQWLVILAVAILILPFLFFAYDFVKINFIHNTVLLDEYHNLTSTYIVLKDFNLRLYTLVLAAAGIIVAIWRLISQERSFQFEINKFNTQQQNDKYAKAVELLGSDKISVRIGAIFTLRNLVDENPEYTSNFIDILKSYIKSELTSNRLFDNKEDWKNRLDEWSEKNKDILDSHNFYQAYPSRPYRQMPEDIKVTLASLCEKKSSEIVNLQNTDWEGFNLDDTGIREFRYLDFTGSRFDHVYIGNQQKFRNCQLWKLTFNKSHLLLPEFIEPYRDKNNNVLSGDLRFDKVYINSIYLSYYLSQSVFTNSRLENAMFNTDKPLQNVCFVNSILTRCRLNNPLVNVVFYNCHMLDPFADAQYQPYSGLFLLGVEIQGSEGNFLRTLSNDNLPVSSYRETDKNIVIIDQVTYDSNLDLLGNFNFTSVRNDPDLLSYFNLSQSHLADLIRDAAIRGPIGLVTSNLTTVVADSSSDET